MLIGGCKDSFNQMWYLFALMGLQESKIQHQNPHQHRWKESIKLRCWDLRPVCLIVQFSILIATDGYEDSNLRVVSNGPGHPHGNRIRNPEINFFKSSTVAYICDWTLFPVGFAGWMEMVMHFWERRRTVSGWFYGFLWRCFGLGKTR